MSGTLVRIALRLLLCAGVAFAVWRLLGLVSMMLTLPLFGIALARPLLDLASDLRHSTRFAVWHAVEGRHFVYRGVPIQVLEDADRQRWVRAADVRAVIGRTATNGALALTYPSGWQAMGRPAEPHISDTALLAHLKKERSPEALRFRHWVEREIAFPARRLRARAGVKPAAVDSRTGD